MSAIVSYTMDIQRQNVFYAQQKIANQVEELNRALDVKSVFFGHMSHELRTPLNAIIGFSDMLKTMDDKTLTREKVHEYAEYINSGGNHLLSLVNDILDQNKLEAGGIAVSIERVDVCELLQNYVDELNPISMDKQKQVNLHFDDEALYLIRANVYLNKLYITCYQTHKNIHRKKASLICPRSGLLKILKSAFKIMARGFLLKLFNKSIKPAFLLKRILFQKRKVRGLV
ncbi:MAG: hypothetical protein HOI58_07295 [Kordiimonadaceae bacterium]|nr:hypothetical protein [Kordiimonadaceae bacterium]